MSKKQGVVESFNPDGKRVGRGSTVYSFKLDDGNWYRTGFDKPPIDEGDKVQFEFTDGKYGLEVEVKSMKVKKNPNGGPSHTAGAVGAGGVPRNSGEYWANKEVRDIELQKRIGYAGCLNSALALMGNMGDNFPVSASKMKSKEGVEAAQAVLVEMADEFFELINTRPDSLAALKAPEEPANGQDELEQTEKEAEKEVDKKEDDFDDWD